MIDKTPEDMRHDYFLFGFQISKKAWEWLDLGEQLTPAELDSEEPGIYTVRKVSDGYNKKRFLGSHPHRPVFAGELISVGIIVDILRYLIALYNHDDNPGSISGGLEWTRTQKGAATVDLPPSAFVELFPPIPILRGQEDTRQYLASLSKPGGMDGVIAELILLSLSLANPAFQPFRDLFDDEDLKVRAPYVPLVTTLEKYFDNQPVVSALGRSLFECLRAPMLASPDSLEGQLEYIRKYWAAFLPAGLLQSLYLASDVLQEERQIRGWGGAPAAVLDFRRDLYDEDARYPEPAAFSRDADWMSNVVLIAKSAHVWLFQLSRKYGRDIHHLDHVPDEELDLLARWGFTSLWLIGVWERSSASQKIKQIMGNPEAAPSAYSLYDYTIAGDLGGEEAYQDLRHRAWERGIRLASDMVPNHMGIHSRWVVEHPDWFVQASQPPYPCYQFTGVDLCDDDRVTVQIEDGYWEHRDAAVVFKRIDRRNNDVRYIYHGNDGTSTPWNDTAQLNFMLPEVREAVVQTILHVARKFPVIRFDAAMTLAKKHYQRLWFPKAGDGGAIPSRAEYGMSKAEFDRVFPKEFWREVVDRVAAEVPDTLLLAEAFWLMEGYFVRTLGMHRVYNSAFMNMLKMEENSKYRLTVKNVLEFSPEILKRFVNFMNNPDERTAVEQFGKGDKYYGVAMMMVTMPGLPMFGHGQIEGFAEKYGMEYYRSYWDEQVDDYMVRRHEYEIFPLMHRRNLFSGAENFALYDFVSPDGWVDENVFAYSNRAGGERAVIMYNNSYTTTRGSIHTSTAINVGSGDEKSLVRRSLAEALDLRTDEKYLYLFRDHRSGLEYIRSGRQIADEGLFASLQGYQYHAFLDFREIYDEDGSWTVLRNRLHGMGVPNIDEAFREYRLEPVLGPFRTLLTAENIRAVLSGEADKLADFKHDLAVFYEAVQNFTGASLNVDVPLNDVMAALPRLVEAGIEEVETQPPAAARVTGDSDSEEDTWSHVILAWLVVKQLTRFLEATDEYSDAAHHRVDYLERWLLRKYIERGFIELGGDESAAYYDSLLVTIMTGHEKIMLAHDPGAFRVLFEKLLDDIHAREYLHIHRHDDVLWVNKENLERLIMHLVIGGRLVIPVAEAAAIDTLKQSGRDLLAAAERAGYDVEKLLADLTEDNESTD